MRFLLPSHLVLHGIGDSEWDQDSDQTNASCFSLRRFSPRMLFHVEITQSFWFLYQHLRTSAAYLEELPAIHHPQKSNGLQRGDCHWQAALGFFISQSCEAGKVQKSPAGVAPAWVCLGELCLLLVGAAVTTETVPESVPSRLKPGLAWWPRGHLIKSGQECSCRAGGSISVPLKALGTFPLFQRALDQSRGYPGTDFEWFGFFSVPNKD